ncbi:MAG: shikimate kinase [Xanthomonadales bacterium]|nr:shikimate kinase [Xanthomonadales bacterium]
MNPSSNLFLVGPMGAGKTSVGRRLARQFGMRFVDLDQEIEAASGAPIVLIFELEGETGFRQRESAALQQFSAEQGMVLACGGGVVVSADNRQQLRRHGFVVYLQTQVEHQIERLRRDTQRPLLASTDRRQRLQALNEAREPMYQEVADLCITPQQEPIRRACARITEQINTHWQRLPLLDGERT